MTRYLGLQVSQGESLVLLCIRCEFSNEKGGLKLNHITEKYIVEIIY